MFLIKKEKNNNKQANKQTNKKQKTTTNKQIEIFVFLPRFVKHQKKHFPFNIAQVVNGK